MPDDLLFPFLFWFQYRDFGRLWQVYGRSILRYVTWRKLENALRLEYAYRTRQPHFRAFPYLVNFEPIYHCNLACPLCDRQAFPENRPKEERRLPLEVVDKVLDELGPYLFQVQIFGLGEPLLDWPRTRAIIERAHRRNIFTLVSTNATILTDAMADEIVTCGLDYLVCAIDGVRQENYARYRVGGRVEQALENLRALVRSRRRHRSPLQIEWQFLVHRHNQEDQEVARQLARKMGVYLRFAPLRGMEFEPELQQEWLPDACPHTADDFFDQGRASAGKSASSLACYFLWRSLIVTSRGTATRCPIHHNSAHYGSLETHSVQELFQSPDSRRARELFRHYPSDVEESGEMDSYPMPCASCGFFQRRRGGVNRAKSENVASFRKELPMLKGRSHPLIREPDFPASDKGPAIILPHGKSSNL